MNKKKMIICIVIAILMAFVGIYYYTHKEKPQEITYEADDMRNERLKEFAKPQLDTPEIEITENAGGSSEISIANRASLLKFKSADIMISVDEKISDSVKLIPTIAKDIKGFSEDRIKSYYDGNKESIISILGIDSFNKFIDFTKKISFLTDNTVESVSIVENTLKKNGNVINFDLEMITTNKNTSIFNIKIIVSEEGSKTTCLVYWN